MSESTVRQRRVHMAAAVVSQYESPSGVNMREGCMVGTLSSRQKMFFFTLALGKYFSVCSAQMCNCGEIRILNGAVWFAVCFSSPPSKRLFNTAACIPFCKPCCIVWGYFLATRSLSRLSDTEALPRAPRALSTQTQEPSAGDALSLRTILARKAYSGSVCWHI